MAACFGALRLAAALLGQPQGRAVARHHHEVKRGHVASQDRCLRVYACVSLYVCLCMCVCVLGK